jgi:uncharacterized membrane protein YphA (DoxX/SURF4 family)
VSISGRVARPLLASVFITEGLDSLRNPAGKVKGVRPVTLPLTQRITALPDDTETLIRINGAIQVGAGVLLATGRFRRSAAVALIGSIVPTTYAGHRFWEETDDTTRKQQRTDLMKNLGLLGGLILAAADTEGAPSLGWRARYQVRRVAHAVAVARALSGDETGRGAGTASKRSTGSSRKANTALAHAAKAGAGATAPAVAAGAELAGSLLAKAHDHQPDELTRTAAPLTRSWARSRRASSA